MLWFQDTRRRVPLRLLVATLLVLTPSASTRRAGTSDRSSSSSSSSSASSSIASLSSPLARLSTSNHGTAPTGEIIPTAGRGTFPEFLADLKRAADRKMLSRRAIEFVFGEGSFALDCRGLWLEFGVYDGTTLGMAANWRREHCDPAAPPVFGFDTFEGLPETWDQGDGGDTWERGSFDLRGKLPAVPENAKLVKGLFADTLPLFLAEVRGLARHYSYEEEGRGGGGGGQGGASGNGGSKKNKSNNDNGATSSSSSSSSSSQLDSHVNPSGVEAAGTASSSYPYGYGRGSLHASFIHIDCDLYAGARDALSLLSPLIKPGTVLVFDDFVNYPSYREHEVKALWEWVASTGLHLRVIGVKGPLPAEEEEEKEEEEKEKKNEGKVGSGDNGNGGSKGSKSNPEQQQKQQQKQQRKQAPPPPPPHVPQKTRAVDLDPKRAAPHHHQSVAFVVV